MKYLLRKCEIFANANAGKFHFTSTEGRYFTIHEVNYFTFAARRIFHFSFRCYSVTLFPYSTASKKYQYFKAIAICNRLFIKKQEQRFPPALFAYLILPHLSLIVNVKTRPQKRSGNFLLSTNKIIFLYLLFEFKFTCINIYLIVLVRHYSNIIFFYNIKNNLICNNKIQILFLII